MKRTPSGGIIAAAVFLIIAAGLALFIASIHFLAFEIMRTMDAQSAAAVRELIWPTLEIAAAAWGIATAVGLLRLHRWAYFCVFAMSALLVADAVPSLQGAATLIHATTGIPTESAPGFLDSAYFMFAISAAAPLALAIWWLVFFPRRSVRRQFFAADAVEAAPAPESADFGAAVPVAFVVPASAEIPQGPQRPVSIFVIAIFLVVDGPLKLLALISPNVRRMPIALFGHLLWPSSNIAYLLCLGMISTVLGLGLMLRKQSALVGTIIFLILQMANSVATALRPQLNDEIMKVSVSIHPDLAQIAPMMSRLSRSMLPAFIGLVLAFYLAALYFLWSRRKAFAAWARAGEGKSR
jgi:hypothetical protein